MTLHKHHTEPYRAIQSHTASDGLLGFGYAGSQILNAGEIKTVIFAFGILQHWKSSWWLHPETLQMSGTRFWTPSLSWEVMSPTIHKSTSPTALWSSRVALCFIAPRPSRYLAMLLLRCSSLRWTQDPTPAHSSLWKVIKRRQLNPVTRPLNHCLNRSRFKFDHWKFQEFCVLAWVDHS